MTSWDEKRPPSLSHFLYKKETKPLAAVSADQDLFLHQKRKSPSAAEFANGLVGTGRRGGIRTRDPLHPMQVRYQAALHAEKGNYSKGYGADVTPPEGIQ